MLIYKTTHGNDQQDRTITEESSVPADVTDHSIYVVVGTAVKRHYTLDTKIALDAIKRRIEHDKRVNG